MWSKTSLAATTSALITILVLCAGFPAPTAAQSSTDPNPGNPTGPTVFAPNPPPPPPLPTGVLILTPAKPDPEKPGAKPDPNQQPQPPGIDPDPNTGSGENTADRTALDKVKDSPPNNAVQIRQTNLDSQRRQDTRARIKAMEASALDASRPTFSLLESTLTADSAPVEPAFEPGQVLLSVGDIENAKRIQQQIAGEGYRVKSRRVFKLLNMVTLAVRTPDGVSAPDAVSALSARFPDVIVDLNHRYVALGLASSKSYAHDLMGFGDKRKKCPASEPIGMIDTAVATTHPVFKGASIEQMSVLVAGTKPASADHGTGVAALLVGRADSEFAPATAQGAKLVVVEVFRRGERGQIITTAELVIAALEKLLGQQLRVINLSFGGAPNRLLKIGVSTVVSKGVSLIAAAGNSASGSPLFPAGYDEVVAVTAVDAARKPIKDAPHGAYIDIAAPGVDIWTATADGEGKYATGTSFAAPYVSAFIARIISMGGNPNADSVAKAIQSAARDLGEPGYDSQYGWGLLSFSGACS